MKAFTAAVRPMYRKAVTGLSDKARKVKLAQWVEDIEAAEKYQLADVDKRMQRAILQLKPLVIISVSSSHKSPTNECM